MKRTIAETLIGLIVVAFLTIISVGVFISLAVAINWLGEILYTITWPRLAGFVFWNLALLMVGLTFLRIARVAGKGILESFERKRASNKSRED